MATRFYKKDGTPTTRQYLGLAPKVRGSKKDRLRVRKAVKNALAKNEAEKNDMVGEILNGKTPVL